MQHGTPLRTCLTPVHMRIHTGWFGTGVNGSKRLQANHSIIRRRIGIRRRLFFYVNGVSLEVIDFIDRQDLEKAIRNFGRNE